MYTEEKIALRLFCEKKAIAEKGSVFWLSTASFLCRICKCDWSVQICFEATVHSCVFRLLSSVSQLIIIIIILQCITKFVNDVNSINTVCLKKIILSVDRAGQMIFECQEKTFDCFCLQHLASFISLFERASCVLRIGLFVSFAQLITFINIPISFTIHCSTFCCPLADALDVLFWEYIAFLQTGITTSFFAVHE